MFVYKLINKINNKYYIGITTTSDLNLYIEKQHFKSALEWTKKGNRYIHNAIRKYGRENFIYEKIDEAKSVEFLGIKEKFYIKLYNSNNPKFGYNCSNGGDGIKGFKVKRNEIARAKMSKIRIERQLAVDNKKFIELKV